MKRKRTLQSVNGRESDLIRSPKTQPRTHQGCGRHDVTKSNKGLHTMASNLIQDNDGEIQRKWKKSDNHTMLCTHKQCGLRKKGRTLQTTTDNNGQYPNW